MNSLLPWLIGIPVVLVVGAVFWYLFAHSRRPVPEDFYTNALEMWLAGDLEAAGVLLREAIDERPGDLDPFLQLGNLLRLQGDAQRAGILHRGLTVRPGLSEGRKVTIGLALAQDLVALQRWDEVKAVLDPLRNLATGNATYWWCRFAQYHGQQEANSAARVLKRAQDSCPQRNVTEFVSAYNAYQLDRALVFGRENQFPEAQKILKEYSGKHEEIGRAAFVKAVIAARQKDAAAAIAIVSEHLLDRPQEISLLLPVLQDVLLETGQYARTIPILERVCQAEKSAPSLWIALAMLYEKLGRRDEALRLLETKRGDAQFTPDAAAPYLRILAGECVDTDFSLVWDSLSPPAVSRGWECADCGRQEVEVRWFCPNCRGFDTFDAVST